MIALLVGTALGADPSPLLDQPAYRFCNEPGVDRAQALLWCDSLEGLPADVCPGLRETCAGATGPESGCNGAGGEIGRTGAAPEEATRAPEFPELSCGDVDTGFLETVAKWTMAALVGLLVAVLLRLLVRWMGRDRTEAVVATAVAADDVPADADEVPDRPSEDLLAAARAALAAGRAAEAVWLARGAALRRLAERGRITLHRSRTDREHVRSVRTDPAIYDDLREVARCAERARWGALGIDRDVARHAIDAAARLVSVIAALTLFVPAAWAADRYGPRGDAGLGALLERAGHTVIWRTEPLEKLDATTDLLVLDLGWVLPTLDDELRLRAWVEEGGVLLVAGDAAGTFPELGTWTDAPDPPALAGWLVASGVEAPHWPAEVAVWSGGEALLGTPGAAALTEIPLGAGVLLGLADGRLLENGSLIRPENRVFLAELFPLGQAVGGWPIDSPIRVELATRAFAMQEHSGGCLPAEGLANGRLIALVLQVLLVWGLVAALRAPSLTVPRDPPAEDRLLFSDHGQALARRTWRTGDRGWADAAFARLWLRRLGSAGIQSAAVRAGQTPAAARALAERVEALARDSTADPELVEALWRITR